MHVSVQHTPAIISSNPPLALEIGSQSGKQLQGAMTWEAGAKEIEKKREIPHRYQVFEGTKYRDDTKSLKQDFTLFIDHFHSYPGRKNKVIKLTQTLSLSHKKNELLL